MNRSLRGAILTSSIAGMVMLTSACGGAGQGAENADGPILIGVPVGLTGANSVIAPSVVQASELAVEQINASGGVLGRDLEMRVYDDQSGAEGAVKAFNTAILKDGVVGIVGMETSAARNAGQPIALKSNTPYVYTSTYEGGACGPNLFHTSGVPEQMAAPVVDHVEKTQNPDTWFLIGADYAAGRGFLDFIEERIESNGDKVVGKEFNPLDSPDWTSILQKLRAAQPDVLVSVLSGGAPNVAFFKQLKQGGFSMTHANMSLDEDTARALGGDAAGTLYSSPYFTELETPGNEDFLDALKAKFGAKTETPNFLSMPQYNGVHLLAQAIERAGSTQPNEIIDALSQVEFEGPAGTVQMNVQHHAALNFYLGQVRQDGTTEVVADFGKVSPGEQCPGLD